MGYRWEIVAQLHGPDIYSASPAWSLHAENEFYIEMTAGDMQHMTWIDYKLSNGDLNKGNWVDFVVKLVYSRTDGAFTLWRRDEGQTDFVIVAQQEHIPTLQWSSAEELPPYDSRNPTYTNHYWKHGLYRDPSYSNVAILWLDGFTIGRSFQGVVNAAFPQIVQPTTTPLPTSTATATLTPTLTPTITSTPTPTRRARRHRPIKRREPIRVRKEVKNVP